jgi:hypothetical protein
VAGEVPMSVVVCGAAAVRISAEAAVDVDLPVVAAVDVTSVAGPRYLDRRRRGRVSAAIARRRSTAIQAVRPGAKQHSIETEIRRPVKTAMQS